MIYLSLVTGGLLLILVYSRVQNVRLSRQYQRASRNEQRFRLIWQQVPDILTEIDPDGRILSVNHLPDDADTATVVGHNSREFLDQDQYALFSRHLAEVRQTLRPATYELQIHSPAGGKRWLRNQLVPVVRDGLVHSLMVISSDVTDERLAQQVLAREKDQAQEESLAKSRFLASMSHEIRTPMTGLIGMVSLLEQTPLTTDQQNFLRVIQQSSDHLLSIVNDILDSSKIDANMLVIENEAFSVRQMVDGLVDMMAPRAREKGLAIQSFVDSCIPGYLCGDAIRIRQILMNFLTNALKFTDHGHVLLRLVLVSRSDKGLRIRFSVEDSGIGISAEQALHIFDEYSPGHGRRSTLAGGTGLGLSICRRLATLMGGKVGVLSSAGLGSNFWLDLELSQVATDSVPEQSALPLPDKSIWVLDELQVNRSLVVSVARNIPVDVREFSECAQIIRAAEQGLPTLLVVSDRCLQAHFDFIRTLAARGVLLAVSSSMSTVPDNAQLAEAGVRAFWDWPVGQDHLQRILRRLLSGDVPGKGLITRTDAVSQQTDSSTDRQFRLKILLAEDNPVNQKVAAQMLRRLGCQVVVASDGKVAADACREQPFDLVLMDCHMPVMDGLQATREIRTIPGCADLPVLALSADVMAEQKAACEAAGMNGYITKPVRIGDLRRALEPYAD